MSKKCEDCGKFMKLTNLMPDEDEFDFDLAYECGLTEEEEGDAMLDLKGGWSRFRYIQDQWECESCQVTEWHTEGQRYYYDYERNNYFADAKPLTPCEIAEQARQAQEDAGQMALEFPIDDEAQS